MIGLSSANPKHRAVTPTLPHGPRGSGSRRSGHGEGDDWRVLAAARGGDEAAVGQICDRHGAAVFVLACVISGEREFAQAVTVDVLAEACTDPANPTEPTDAAGTPSTRGSLRHDLAQRTYQRCAPPARTPARTVTTVVGHPDRGPGPIVAELARLGFQQRTAIALTCLGDHDYRDVAGLLGLATTTTAGLIASGLHEIHDLRGPRSTPTLRPPASLGAPANGGRGQ